MNTTWYLHSHREWLRLSNSSIVAQPSVCLAAHGSERHDGPPNMSNFCCLPGIAGGLPGFIYGPDDDMIVDITVSGEEATWIYSLFAQRHLLFMHATEIGPLG